MSGSTNDKSAATKKEIQLALNDKTIKRAGDALAAMKEDFSKRTPKRPAEELVRQYISEIDELTKLGASLPQIFERLNKAVRLGVSANSFSVYVRRVRKEIGSVYYNQRQTKKQTEKDDSCAAPVAAMDEMTNAPAEQVETAETWNCEQCKDAVRHESKKYPGKFYWQCAICKTNYKDDAGQLTSVVL